MHATVRLFLLRHAEVEERYQHTFGGRINMDLSPLGHQQAERLARYVGEQKIDALYASPMKRVQQTLEPLLQSTALRPVVLPELVEVDFGEWSGLTREQVHERFNAAAADWLALLESGRMPKAEPLAAVRGRLESFLDRVTSQHANQNVAVVCHGGVIRMLLALLLRQPLSTMASFDIEYASLTRVDFQPHKTRVKLLNFTPWRDLP